MGYHEQLAEEQLVRGHFDGLDLALYHGICHVEYEQSGLVVG